MDGYFVSKYSFSQVSYIYNVFNVKKHVYTTFFLNGKGKVLNNLNNWSYTSAFTIFST